MSLPVQSVSFQTGLATFMTAPNKNKVPKKQWRKWSRQARAVFNEIYEAIYRGHRTLFPPAFTNTNFTAKTIKVMAWNSAWVAASACDEFAC